MKKIFLISLLLIISSCKDSSANLTKDDVKKAIQSSGVTVNDIKDKTKDSSSIAPQSFDYAFEFSILEVAPRGGQAFICSKQKYCDATFEYYDALKALAGPFLYRSKSGKVILQLNSGLSVETAEKLEKSINNL